MDDKHKSWAKLVGIVLGTAALTVLTSLTTANAATSGVKEEAAAEAKAGVKDVVDKAAGAKATAEAARAEAAVAAYIKDEFEPAIAEAFDGVDEELDDLRDELGECRASVREATVLADTALRLIERRYGRAAVERTLGAVDRAEPKSTRAADKKAEHKPAFKDYQQKVVVPTAADGG